jgi:hypothetical protein
MEPVRGRVFPAYDVHISFAVSGGSNQVFSVNIMDYSRFIYIKETHCNNRLVMSILCPASVCLGFSSLRLRHRYHLCNPCGSGKQIGQGSQRQIRTLKELITTVTFGGAFFDVFWQVCWQTSTQKARLSSSLLERSSRVALFPYPR